MKKELALLAMTAVLIFTMPCLAEDTAQALYRACMNGDVECVKRVYPDMKPGGLDQEIKIGIWPLIAAVENGHLELVIFLVEHGANYLKKTRCGQSLLQLALSRGHTKIAQWLLRKGKVPPASPRKAPSRPALLRSFSDRRSNRN